MYKFYLDGVLMPVAPEKMTTKIKGKNKTVDLVNEGEASILKTPGLTDYEFELLIPSVPYLFSLYEGGFKSVGYYLGVFEKLKTDVKSFRFNVERQDADKVLFDTSQTVSLEDYTIEEDAEEGTDLIVKISLKQYKPYLTKKINIATISAENEVVVTSQPAEAERPTKEPVQSYTVKAGDTLWAICKRQLGDGSKYPEVAKLNDIKNANLIFPGQVIRFD